MFSTATTKMLRALPKNKPTFNNYKLSPETLYLLCPFIAVTLQQKTNAFINSECYWVLRTRTNKLFTFENEAYNFPEQYILRVLISLPTNKTAATFVVSAIVDDNYSCSSIYRYFGGLSLSMSHTIFLSSAL